jgi:hypothetical protein
LQFWHYNIYRNELVLIRKKLLFNKNIKHFIFYNYIVLIIYNKLFKIFFQLRLNIKQIFEFIICLLK